MLKLVNSSTMDICLELDYAVPATGHLERNAVFTVVVPARGGVDLMPLVASTETVESMRAVIERSPQFKRWARKSLLHVITGT